MVADFQLSSGPCEHLRINRERMPEGNPHYDKITCAHLSPKQQEILDRISREFLT